MSVANLHSIFSGRWYIEERYASGHIPLVLSILNKKGNAVAVADKERPEIVAHVGPNLNTGSSSNQTNEKFAVVLSIKEPIVKYDQYCGPEGTKSMQARLEKYRNNDACVGIVLDIDSGGGQVYGTPEFYDFIKSYPKPVVSYTDGLMCSAAYYIGSAASHIIANNRADCIGSIGAYSELFDFDGYYEKNGVKVHRIYATKSTEKNKAYRDAMAGDEDGYNEYRIKELDPIVETFHKDMKEARPNIDQSVFKGAVYGAKEAEVLGLIDEIGTLQTAINKVFELSNDNNKTNSQAMKNTAFTMIMAALAVESLESNDKGFYLNEEQMQALENEMGAITKKATDAEAALTVAQTAQKSAEDSATAHVATIEGLAQSIGAEKGADVAATVANAEARIAEINGEAGDQHTNLGKKQEDGSDDYAYIDFNSPIYKN